MTVFRSYLSELRLVVFVGVLALGGCSDPAAKQAPMAFEPADEVPADVTDSPQTPDVAGENASPQQPAVQQASPPAEKPAEQPAEKPAEKRASAPAEKPAEKPAAQHPANRLAKETSPYLLMHAHNPVDWHPWDAAALEKARQEDKVIFLSIGYSSCHWCHVMERESFMDEEIAAFLNKHFICSKGDREERPDGDGIYMAAVLLTTGRGGWPMSVFMTPDARPFFGATYFPARDGDRPQMPGFLTVIQRIQTFWESQREDFNKQADQITEAVKSHLDGRRPRSINPLDSRLLSRVQAKLAEDFDPTYGGFSSRAEDPNAPKFPVPSNLMFLLYRMEQETLAQDQRDEARQMLVHSLERMAMGGIRDHLAGGFHRYSVDRFWRIPHFEKMLYDNGQLATVYAEAYRLTGREDFRRVLVEMLDFVLREMTSPEGGFYSALDADSEGEEGKFYRWTKEEVVEELTEEEFELFAAIYGLDQAPNFEGEFYAPQLSMSLSELGAKRGVTAEQLDGQLQSLRSKLLAVRDKRIRPLTDTKVLTGWNGLMIRGLADAGRVLQDDRYVAAAQRAAEFVLAKLRTPTGRLLRTYGQGKAQLNAYLDDYAFLIDGLIGVYLASGEERWLQIADSLMQGQLAHFWDAANGGFFFTSDDHESLLARGKNPADSARPSGNSVSAQNLVFLGKQLGNSDYLAKAKATIQAVSGVLDGSPDVAPRMVLALAATLQGGGDAETGSELPPEPPAP